MPSADAGERRPLTALRDALDALAASDPQVYADTSSIEVLHQELARLEGVTTEAVPI
jgi:hypothetical protein